MVKQILVFLVLTTILTSCNNIPEKPVFEKLSTEELAAAIKIDTSFSNFYEVLRKEVDELDDIKKAKYNDVTYQRLFSYFKFLKDTAYWNPSRKKWDNEWQKDFGKYSPKADSTLNYWKKYIAENSLNKYVKIQLAQIDKEYYEYAGGLKNVSLGFKLTPLQGPIEQITFSYGYMAKINGDRYYEKHNCISTSPFSSPTVRFWEVGYSDKEKFSGKNVATFLRDYNLDIEIESIRKSGVNISADNLNVPPEVSDYFKYGENDTLMKDYYRDKVIKSIVNKSYVAKLDYHLKKADEIKEKEDKLCFDFLNELYKEPDL
jgi:hypothetical protein